MESAFGICAFHFVSTKSPAAPRVSQNFPLSTVFSQIVSTPIVNYFQKVIHNPLNPLWPMRFSHFTTHSSHLILSLNAHQRLRLRLACRSHCPAANCAARSVAPPGP